MTAGQAATLDFALSKSVIVAAGSRHDGDRRTASRGARQRRRQHRRAAQSIETSPISNVADLLNSRAAGRAGARRHADRRRLAHSHARQQLALAHQRADLRHRRRSHDERHGRRRIGTGGNGRQPRRRHQPRGDREHRDREGTVGRDALRHGRRERRRRHHDEEGPRRLGRSGTSTPKAASITDRNNYPNNYTIAGHSPDATAYRECALLADLAPARCIAGQRARSTAPINDPDATPLGTGNRTAFGAQVRGGTETVRYFLSGRPVEMRRACSRCPTSSAAASTRQGLDAARLTPSGRTTQGKNSFRANLNAAVTPKLDIGGQRGLHQRRHRFSLESNATAGLGSHTFGGPGYRTNGLVSGSRPLGRLAERLPRLDAGRTAGRRRRAST